MSLSTLKQHIADKIPGTCYIFHGEESYLREYYTNQLASCVYPDGADKPVKLDGKGLTPHDLLDAVEGVSMFGGRKLVIINDCDIGKPEARIKDTLENLVVPDEVTVLFTYSSPEFKPDKRTKSYKSIAAQAVEVEFKKQTETDLMPWLKRRFKAYGKDISSDDARHLLFTCGNLMTNLCNEVVKIAAYSSGNSITRTDIDTIASPVVETVVFALTDELTAGRYDRAAARLHELQLQREEPIMLLSLLGKQLRGLYAAKLCQSIKELMDVMGYKSEYPARKLSDAARRLSIDWCRNAVILVCEYDRQLKTSTIDKDSALAELLAKLAMANK